MRIDSKFFNIISTNFTNIYLSSNVPDYFAYILLNQSFTMQNSNFFNIIVDRTFISNLIFDKKISSTIIVNFNVFLNINLDNQDDSFIDLNDNNCNISFDNNSFSYSFNKLMSISASNTLEIKNIFFNLNSASPVVIINNMMLITINNFNCQNHIGNCLILQNILLINISNSSIINSTGLTLIPGIRLINILNKNVLSIMNIFNSFFHNNTFISSDTVSSFGCSLEIYNVNQMHIENVSFSKNYVALFSEKYSGPSLFYSNIYGSVFIKYCLFQDNIALKSGVIIEFIGLNLTIENSNIINNSETTDSYILYANSAWINGEAQLFNMNNCNIISGFIYYGIYYLDEILYLHINLDKVNLRGTFAHYTNAVNEQDNTNNRTVVFSNSIFRDNINDNGAFLVQVDFNKAKSHFSIIVMNVEINNCIATLPDWIPIVFYFSFYSNNNFVMSN